MPVSKLPQFRCRMAFFSALSTMLLSKGTPGCLRDLLALAHSQQDMANGSSWKQVIEVVHQADGI